MKILNTWNIPGTGKKYQIHIVKYHKEKTDFEVYSMRSKKYLKDTMSFGAYRGLNRVFGISFLDDKGSTVQRKMYLKELIKMCGIEL